MPWPMVHFAVANEIYLSDVSPSFLIGSIAPDAIHMRDNITRQDKGTTHLVCDDQLPSVAIIKENGLKYLNKSTELAWKEYILGYFAHIYTDLRWTETLYTEFERIYQGDRQYIRKIYNQEMSQVEYDLMNSGSWAQSVISKLQRAKAYTIEPFITEDEVNQYKDVKLEWLLNVANEPKIELFYYLENKVRDFIVETAAELKQLLQEWNVEFRMI